MDLRTERSRVELDIEHYIEHYTYPVLRLLLVRTPLSITERHESLNLLNADVVFKQRDAGQKLEVCSSASNEC